MIQRKNPRFARVAFFSVAHGVYFSQFEGLYDTLMGYHRETVELVAGNGVEVVDLGMVCSNREGFETAARINGSSVDLIICNMITYATSSVFAPVVQNTTAPVILLALQPRKALDYTMASTRMQLENDNICSVPEFIGVANRMNRKIYDVIIGKLYGDEDAVKEIREQGKDEYFDLESQIKEALEKARQEEIDKLSEINDSINDTNSRLLDAMQSTIDQQRQERDNAETEEELEEPYGKQDGDGQNTYDQCYQH